MSKVKNYRFQDRELELLESIKNIMEYENTGIKMSETAVIRQLIIDFALTKKRENNEEIKQLLPDWLR